MEQLILPRIKARKKRWSLAIPLGPSSFSSPSSLLASWRRPRLIRRTYSAHIHLRSPKWPSFSLQTPVVKTRATFRQDFSQFNKKLRLPLVSPIVFNEFGQRRKKISKINTRKYTTTGFPLLPSSSRPLSGFWSNLFLFGFVAATFIPLQILRFYSSFSRKRSVQSNSFYPFHCHQRLTPFHSNS